MSENPRGNENAPVYGPMVWIPPQWCGFVRTSSRDSASAVVNYVMKRHVAVILIVVVVAAAIAVAYLSGVWLPNSSKARSYPIRGIDVSHHQGSIDWSAVASDRIEFAYIKATEGESFRDSSFSTNWSEAGTHRVIRGAYHFFRFNSPGQKQADHFRAIVPVDISALPPAVDLEFWGNSDVRPSVAAFRAELQTFLSSLNDAYGKEPVIYTTEEFQSVYLSDDPPKRLWIRHVVTRPRLDPQVWLFWQFSDRGRVSGINGLVDLNVFAGDRSAFDALVRNKSAAKHPLK
jgi:lysozyme